jgi:hypothetical protein
MQPKEKIIFDNCDLGHGMATIQRCTFVPLATLQGAKLNEPWKRKCLLANLLMEINPFW